MKSYFEILKQHIEQNPPSFGETDSVLEMLYDCHNERNSYDNDQIKADFNTLYQQMHGMPLREIDKVIYTVYTLCRDHERAGFTEGVKVGTYLAKELLEYRNERGVDT